MASLARPSHCAAELRRELSERNLQYAAKHGLAHCLSYGGQPVVCYVPDEEAQQHGNFLPATYRAILRNAAWRRRLDKVHAQAGSSLPRRETGRWRELDSANSSDALLLNVFCCPGVFRDGRIAALLGVAHEARPEFGVRARVPILLQRTTEIFAPLREQSRRAERADASVRSDRTEIDMRLGDLLVEAKLTESDFQVAPVDLVERYRDFALVFDRRLLPRARGHYLHYQLIRNVLAAQASGCAFCVLLDARRPDLLEAWYEVLRAIRHAELRVRAKALAWQELAAVLPRQLARFLEEKYGIVYESGKFAMEEKTSCREGR